MQSRVRSFVFGSLSFLLLAGSCTINTVFAAQQSDGPSLAIRKELCASKSSITQYRQTLIDLIIGSTPLEQGDRWAHKFATSSIAFDIDSDGHISNWKMVNLSGSIARDFWTLYAVASCPPTKSADGANLPLNMKIDNARIALVSTAEAEQWRVQEGYGIPRSAEAKDIYFYLIPASFVKSFPETIGLGAITSKQNLVGISIDELCKNGQKYWSIEAANHLIETDNQVSQFLGEWPKFFKQSPHPSREDITSFADELKIKYKSLLKEGEPEAPLP